MSEDEITDVVGLGYRAQLDGLKKADNPYGINSPGFEAWNRGWHIARRMSQREKRRELAS